jgi:FK506-binding protein 4/5
MPMHAFLAAVVLAGGSVSAQEPKSEIPADTEIVKTASGLAYSVLVAGGAGARPAMGDRVRVHYTGWLVDGTKFDSSRDRGEPAEFKLGEVIGGWNEGLQLMSPGARFKLTIPADLGYGPAGRPPKIPGGATLVFDVELLAFESKPVFPAARADATVTTESGIRYEIVKAGTGASPTAKDVFAIGYSVWDKGGRMLDSSFDHGQSIRGKVEHMRLPFLQEMPLEMRVGEVRRVEVGKKQSFQDEVPPSFGELGEEGITVWLLELESVVTPLPAPTFAMPEEKDLTTTASGLKYKVVKPGEGEAPRMFQSVTVHYAGWLTDGTPFDSSFDAGEPATFRLGQVIAGWNEGLALMKPGAVFQFVIPPQLAYGKEGAGGPIGPDATLVFHVELLKVGG